MILISGLPTAQNFSALFETRRWLDDNQTSARDVCTPVQEFGHSFPAPREMKGVSETGLLPLLRGQRLDGLQVKVVVKMQIAQALPVDKKVEHVVSLSAHLEPDLHPVQFCLRVFNGECQEELMYRLDPLNIVDKMKTPYITTHSELKSQDNEGMRTHGRDNG